MLKSRQFLIVFFVSFLALPFLSQYALGETVQQSNFYDASSAKSQPAWHFAFRTGGLYSFKNVDNFDYSVEGGAGFDADVLYAIDPTHSLRLSFGKSGLRLVNNDYRTTAPTSALKPATPPLPPYMHIINRKDKLDVSRAFLSLQFNTPLKNTAGNNTMLYAFAGPGIMYNSVKSEYDTFNDSTLETFHYNLENTDVRVAFQFGLGATYLLMHNLGIDASALYIASMSREETIELTAPDYSPVFDIRLGLTAVF